MARPQLKLLLWIIVAVIANTSSASAENARGVDSWHPVARLTANPISIGIASGTVSEDEYAELRYSHSVLRLAHLLGSSSQSTFYLCRGFNFCLLLILVYWKGWPKVTAVLRRRSALIRRTIEDAQRLGVESRNRLAEIEERFTRLDSEIAALRARADDERERDEKALWQETVNHANRILAYSEREIQAAVQRTKDELRVFAAGCAVEIARQSIRIDAKGDQELISSFLQQLSDARNYLGLTRTVPKVQPGSAVK